MATTRIQIGPADHGRRMNAREDKCPALRPRCRPFTILDAMVLVAATAVGIAVMRRDEHSIIHGVGHLVTLYEVNGFTDSDFIAGIIEGICELRPLAVAWSCAIFLLRLRRPCPSMRRLARQPGFAASLVAVFCSAFSLVGALIAWAISIVTNGPRPFEFEEFTGIILTYLFENRWEVGTAVAAAWLLMALGRNCRREPGWLDRLGCTLGCVWIALAALVYVLTFPE